MKKLLQIGSSLNCGAPGKIAEQIGLLAMSRGWDVYMAHGVRHSNPSQLKTIPMVTPHEEKVHALYSLLLDRHGLGPDGKTKKLVCLELLSLMAQMQQNVMQVNVLKY